MKRKDKSLKVVLVCVMSLSYNRGGIASIGRILVRELVRRGYRVNVLTFDYDGAFKWPGMTVYCQPSKIRILREFVSADYVMSVGDLLSLCWPLVALRKKAIIVKHGVANAGFLHRLVECLIARGAAWGGVSKAVVENDHIKSNVVPNARDPEIFYYDGTPKTEDLLFVGGITEEKGVFVLAAALHLLRDRRILVNKMTFVGEGKDMSRLREILNPGKVPLGCRIEFTGNLTAKEVADQMRKHKCLIVPSMNIVWREAFALTAIEGYSCGCQVIGSDSGGLPESVGPCGQVFPCGDAESLSQCIEKVLAGDYVADIKLIREHLSHYTPQSMVDSYLALMEHGRR